MMRHASPPRFLAAPIAATRVANEALRCLKASIKAVLATMVSCRALPLPEVRDFAKSEVHDHTLVDAKVMSIVKQGGTKLTKSLEVPFQDKPGRLKTLKSHALEAACMIDMYDLYAKGGTAFARATGASELAIQRVPGAKSSASFSAISALFAQSSHHRRPDNRLPESR